MRIAVAGSGIAGLVAGYRLQKQGHEVTLLERMSRPGLSAHRVELQLDDVAVTADLPSRMFNASEWPNLFQLIQELGLDVASVDVTQSIGEVHADTWMKLADASQPWKSLASMLNPAVRKIFSQAREFQKLGIDDLKTGFCQDLTFREYLTIRQIDTAMIEQFLYPTLSSTVFTCDYHGLDHYPAASVLKTLANLSGKSELFRIKDGVDALATALRRSLFEFRFNETVVRIERQGQEVKVETSAGNSASFDHVVVATQANTATKLFDGSSSGAMFEERALLEKFSYQSIPVFIHTDDSLMPGKKGDWSTFNMLVNPDRSAAMCTVWLNRFHDQWKALGIRKPVFQTINAFQEPSARSVIEGVVLQRPVVSIDSAKALARLNDLHATSNRRIWFCGSYASEGTPLLESGVVSAIRIAQAIQAGMPVA